MVTTPARFSSAQCSSRSPGPCSTGAQLHSKKINKQIGQNRTCFFSVGWDQKKKKKLIARLWSREHPGRDLDSPMPWLHNAASLPIRVLPSCGEAWKGHCAVDRAELKVQCLKFGPIYDFYFGKSVIYCLLAVSVCDLKCYNQMSPFVLKSFQVPHTHFQGDNSWTCSTRRSFAVYL